MCSRSSTSPTDDCLSGRCKRRAVNTRCRCGAYIIQKSPPGTLETLLGAIERSGSLIPRDRLTLGLMERTRCGIKGKGVDILHNAALSSLAEGNEALVVRCLGALGELCTEVECSEHLGAIGGHQSVLRLMMRDRETAGRVAERASVEAAEEPLDTLPQEDYLDSGDEDELQVAATRVVSRVVASGCAFPMRATLEGGLEHGHLPLRYDFTIDEEDLGNPPSANCEGMLLPPPCMRSRSSTTAVAAAAWEDSSARVPAEDNEINSNSKSKICILVRPVKARQRSQFDVGFQMWPAAVILSRWLCRNPHTLRGRRVLEVGSGLGLCGLVAAHVASEVTLSDFNPVVLAALEANVALNVGWTVATESADSVAKAGENPTGQCFSQRSPRGDAGWRGQPEGEGTTVAIDAPGLVQVRHLDWDKLDVPKDLDSAKHGRGGSDGRGGGGDARGVGRGERFDVIIASDHICQISDAEGTIRVLRTLLAADGHAHFVLAHPRTRFGVDALAPLLQRSPDLEYACEEITDPRLVDGLEEAEYLAWLKVHVWWAAASSPSRDGEEQCVEACLGDAAAHSEEEIFSLDGLLVCG